VERQREKNRGRETEGDRAREKFGRETEGKRQRERGTEMETGGKRQKVMV
jgi:hypothetical protein